MPEVARMSYEILEKSRDWTHVVIRSSSQIDQRTFMIQLELDRPRTFIAVRATIEAGPPERPPWGVVACVVERA